MQAVNAAKYLCESGYKKIIDISYLKRAFKERSSGISKVLEK